jgi:hypothetical protein
MKKEKIVEPVMITFRLLLGLLGIPAALVQIVAAHAGDSKTEVKRSTRPSGHDGRQMRSMNAMG